MPTSSSATAPKASGSSRIVLLGAGWFLLGIGWGAGMLRLAPGTLVSVGTLWAVVLGSAALLTAGLMPWLAWRRRQSGLPPAQLADVLTTAAVLLVYTAVAFGMLVAVVLLNLNAYLSPGPIRQLTLPIVNRSGYGAQDAFVEVEVDGVRQRIALDARHQSPLAARTIRLTLQRGLLGYWVVRGKKLSIF
ncbi:hypothetical protein [Hymenobacter weizhouensis]|uniref:hypothetical protein n=1 Tax=Hymenobacter sp. YIM 151500-1 TaxID=2987689 RepID=UPI0022263F15|nr:hypothetical protein [Hymenobacter sp. YIM 151500-1]UYZ62736.1 hypothetical protein OIS53_17275 [Hymenobacter sp. YIM 151500-1]